MPTGRVSVMTKAPWCGLPARKPDFAAENAAHDQDAADDARRSEAFACEPTDDGGKDALHGEDDGRAARRYVALRPGEQHLHEGDDDGKPEDAAHHRRVEGRLLERDACRCGDGQADGCKDGGEEKLGECELPRLSARRDAAHHHDFDSAEMRAERIVTHSPQLFEKLSVKGLASRTRPANAIIRERRLP